MSTNIRVSQLGTHGFKKVMKCYFERPTEQEICSMSNIATERKNAGIVYETKFNNVGTCRFRTYETKDDPSQKHCL